ncbi:MAG: TOPRIM nucleotidyl transferase/hydrolase domain-containing protein [Acidimicrobiia bacterium]
MTRIDGHEGSSTAAVLKRALARAVLAVEARNTVILVEGMSDQAAVETLALQQGRDLAQERVSVLAVGGVTNFARFVELLGPHGHALRLAGLYDVAEEPQVESALSAGGLGRGHDRLGLEDLGFYAAVRDLEDELIRSLGPERVERVIDDLGERRMWRSFRNQPAQRHRATGEQLHRFMGTKSGRKIRYGSALVAALEPEDVPRPLELVLARSAPDRSGD